MKYDQQIPTTWSDNTVSFAFMPVVLTTSNGAASSKITFICGLGLVVNASAKVFQRV